MISGIHLNLVPINLFSLSAAILLVGCSSPKPFEIDLMPAPEVYEEDGINPFTDTSPIDDLPYEGILYATDRMPAGKATRNGFT